MYNTGHYNRFITFYTPTDVNNEGSPERTYSETFTSYAEKIKETSTTDEESGKRRTLSKSTWKFPYNEAIVRDGYFTEANATDKKYYVVGLMETIYQTEMEIEAELRV